MKGDLDRMNVVNIQPGDAIVVMHPKRLSLFAQDNIRKDMRKLFPDNDIVILEEGMTLGVYRTNKVCQCKSERTPEATVRLGPHHQQSCPMYVNFQHREKTSDA